jgi:EF-hand domain pair
MIHSIGSSSDKSMTSRAFHSFTQTAALSFQSNRVDAFLAALGCSGSLALLQYQSLQYPEHPLLHSYLVSSAVKFFFNETPTSLDAFWHSSIFAILQGMTLHFVPAYCGAYTKYVLSFVMMMYWKLRGNLWGAADAMGLTIAMESKGWMGLVATNNITQDTTSSSSTTFPWKFLILQYLGGHLLLYGMASLLSIFRCHVRVWLIRQEFISKEILGITPHDPFATTMVSGKERRQRLRTLFQRMDASGDGQLDAVELQVALRAATGTEVSIADTNAIIRSGDCDGNGTVDFDELCASLENFWGQTIQ